jgi:antitoxin component HigA of HigAB toxin-antitoxin module
MSPKRLIQEWHFGPETMKIAEQAFDEAWEQIKQRFDGDAEAARLDLAKAVINAIEDEASDVAHVKAEALKAIHIAYGERLNVDSGQADGDG